MVKERAVGSCGKIYAIFMFVKERIHWRVDSLFFSRTKSTPDVLSDNWLKLKFVVSSRHNHTGLSVLLERCMHISLCSRYIFDSVRNNPISGEIWSFFALCTPVHNNPTVDYIPVEYASVRQRSWTNLDKNRIVHEKLEQQRFSTQQNFGFTNTPMWQMTWRHEWLAMMTATFTWT